MNDRARTAPAAETALAPYLDRELSQLAFIDRVVDLARDPAVPILERLRFLGISCAILDEFFEIRVAAVLQRRAYARAPASEVPDVGEKLAAIRARTLALVDRQYRVWNEELIPELAAAGIHILRRDQWTPAQRRWLHRYFEEQVQPVLSPLGLDPAHPFPRILNKSLNLAIQLSGHDAFGRRAPLAILRAPRALPRVIRLPREVAPDGDSFVFLSGVLAAFAAELFPGMEVAGCWQFRVTRNSDLVVDEEEVENLARALQGELAMRGFAQAVRLEIAEGMPEELVRQLAHHFELDADAVYPCAGPVNLNRVVAVYDMLDRPELKYPPFAPRLPAAFEREQSIFEVIRGGDRLLHHPFDSFQPVIELVRQAARDPDVLAIKQTLYRTGRDSPFVEALIEAARAGKEVTAVVELRARFDEEANIQLANRLQEVGVQVVYGVVGYKTHAKMLLVVRREEGQLRRYVHLGTGNYHPGTARAYTDLSLLTAHPEIGEDVHRIFLQLSGLAPALELRRLVEAPFALHGALLSRIDREIAHARAGRGGRVIAKINALTERGIIDKLYEASQAGVEIDLIVRGACCLRPGVPGLSERIRVRSIVGRFLEHSRVYWFGNGGAPEVFASSADWMERNLLWRVETCFPLLEPAIAERVRQECLDNYLADRRQAWLLGPDGGYRRLDEGAGAHAAQEALLARAAND
ncbi:MAG: polyphosphate kinase 1 [Xanthomonadales bacterium]|nr:polyphosphate kinase 1 [Xanthomonadales bacterium]